MAYETGYHEGLRELDRVFAPRNTPWGRQNQLAIIHRIHGEIITVQFPTDQQRVRLHVDEIQKDEVPEPQYDTVRMHPGAKMPSAKEVQLWTYEKERAEKMGAPPPPMPPGFMIEDPSKLKDRHITRVQHWGIAEPTLDALRNRALPASSINGSYGQHFYSKLYANNFYRDPAGVPGGAGGMPGMGPGGYGGIPGMGPGQDPNMYQSSGEAVVGQRYYPLDGDPMQFCEDGVWRRTKDAHRVQNIWT